MLNRYGFLPCIRNLTRPRFLMPKIQSRNVQAKRSVEDSSVTPPPFKKQFVRQTKAADIHPTTDLDTVEYFFENGSCILYFCLVAKHWLNKINWRVTQSQALLLPVSSFCKGTMDWKTTNWSFRNGIPRSNKNILCKCLHGSLIALACCNSYVCVHGIGIRYWKRSHHYQRKTLLCQHSHQKSGCDWPSDTSPWTWSLFTRNQNSW